METPGIPLTIFLLVGCWSKRFWALGFDVSGFFGCWGLRFEEKILIFFGDWLSSIFPDLITLDLLLLGNACLGGLVSITANCSVVSPASSIFIGAIGAFVYGSGSALLIYFGVDDPVEACNA